MALIKNFGLSGVSSSIQLGKLGPFITGTSNAFSLYDSTGVELENLEIANATLATHAITKAQLDDALSDLVQHITMDFSYNTGTVALATVPAGTRVITVTVEYDTGWSGASNSTSFVEVGDGASANRLFREKDADVTVPGQYYSEYSYKYSSATVINLNVVAGDATGGTGTVSVVLAAEGPQYGVS